jgi:hypothetical protein
MTQSLEIKIKKGRDGKSTLICTRPDGSTTWSQVGDYFPVHDMAHYVVESTLKVPNAFYSLILDGWNMEDFAVKGMGRRLPHEANLVEALVGRLQRDLMPGSDFTARTYNEEVVAVLEGIDNPARREITDEELSVMRVRLRELLQEYKAIAPGGAITLEFERICLPGATKSVPQR